MYIRRHTSSRTNKVDRELKLDSWNGRHNHSKFTINPKNYILCDSWVVNTSYKEEAVWTWKCSFPYHVFTALYPILIHSHRMSIVHYNFCHVLKPQLKIIILYGHNTCHFLDHIMYNITINIQIVPTVHSKTSWSILTKGYAWMPLCTLMRVRDELKESGLWS